MSVSLYPLMADCMAQSDLERFVLQHHGRVSFIFGHAPFILILHGRKIIVCLQTFDHLSGIDAIWQLFSLNQSH